MLRERKAKSSTYDPARRQLRLEVGPGKGEARSTTGTLLLDARGRVVGIDVDPASPERAVVMLGAHEDVTTTREARVSVTTDDGGAVLAVVAEGVDPPKW